MTEHAETPRQEETPEKTTGGESTWVRVELPEDTTVQEIVEVMKEARREWVERVIGKGGGEKKKPREE